MVGIDFLLGLCRGKSQGETKRKETHAHTEHAFIENCSHYLP